MPVSAPTHAGWLGNILVWFCVLNGGKQNSRTHPFNIYAASWDYGYEESKFKSNCLLRFQFKCSMRVLYMSLACLIIVPCMCLHVPACPCMYMQVSYLFLACTCMPHLCQDCWGPLQEVSAGGAAGPVPHQDSRGCVRLVASSLS